MNTHDHLVPDDMKQISTIVAAFVHTSQRNEKLLRKESAIMTNQRQFKLPI